jgi:hypothetical protein
VARVRHHYPRHPIGGYAPRWFTGGEDLSFFDWVWASNYVGASGQSPAALYEHVSEGQWAGYGGKPVTLLQFTDAASVPGVAGHVDCSAYRGTASELRAIILPRTAPVPSPASPKEDPMLLNRGNGAETPIAIPKGTAALRFVPSGTAEIRVEFHGKGAQQLNLSWGAGSHRVDVPDGVHAALIFRADAGAGDVSVAVE